MRRNGDVRETRRAMRDQSAHSQRLAPGNSTTGEARPNRRRPRFHTSQGYRKGDTSIEGGRKRAHQYRGGRKRAISMRGTEEGTNRARGHGDDG